MSETNEFNIKEIRYVWDLNNGLPVIRPILITKIECIEGEIHYSGCFQYDNTGNPKTDYGVVDRKFCSDDVFASVEQARIVSKEMGDYHFEEGIMNKGENNE